MPSHKLVSIEMEFDDGEIHRLTGEQAHRWKEAADGQAVFNHVHGMHFPQLDWKVSKKSSPQTSDWCPTCKQGWDCAKRDQESRTELHELKGIMRSGKCAYDDEGRTICLELAKLETKMSGYVKHIHATALGPTGLPILTENGHKHEMQNKYRSCITETDEEL